MGGWGGGGGRGGRGGVLIDLQKINTIYRVAPIKFPAFSELIKTVREVEVYLDFSSLLHDLALSKMLVGVKACVMTQSVHIACNSDSLHKCCFKLNINLLLNMGCALPSQNR